MKKSLDQEKKYINGFEEQIRKDEAIIRKSVGKNFKTNAEFYIENIELLKKGKIKIL